MGFESSHQANLGHCACDTRNVSLLSEPLWYQLRALGTYHSVRAALRLTSFTPIWVMDMCHCDEPFLIPTWLGLGHQVWTARQKKKKKKTCFNIFLVLGGTEHWPRADFVGVLLDVAPYAMGSAREEPSYIHVSAFSAYASLLCFKANCVKVYIHMRWLLLKFGYNAL